MGGLEFFVNFDLATTLAIFLFTISELLPFVDKHPANGLLHFLFVFVKRTYENHTRGESNTDAIIDSLEYVIEEEILSTENNIGTNPTGIAKSSSET